MANDTMPMPLEYPDAPEPMSFEVGGPRRIGETAVDYAPTAQILTKPTGFMDAYDFTSTRDCALDLMAEKLGCSRSNFGAEYLNATGSSLRYSTIGCGTTTCRLWARGKTGLHRLSRPCL